MAASGHVEYAPEVSEASMRKLRRSLRGGRHARRSGFHAREPPLHQAGFRASARHLHEILGRRARIDISRGTPLTWTLVDQELTSVGK